MIRFLKHAGGILVVYIVYFECSGYLALFDLCKYNYFGISNTLENLTQDSRSNPHFSYSHVIQHDFFHINILKCKLL